MLLLLDQPNVAVNVVHIKRFIRRANDWGAIHWL